MFLYNVLNRGFGLRTPNNNVNKQIHSGMMSLSTTSLWTQSLVMNKFIIHPVCNVRHRAISCIVSIQMI